MATQKQARVALRGRFPAGTRVRLVKVRDETALRAEGGREIDTARVDDSGEVRFTKNVEVGARYLIVGSVNGTPLEVRATGRTADEESAVLTQAPVGPDRVRLADGSWADEAPEKRGTPDREVGPAPGQDQVPKGTAQRSDTPRGSAHPHDPKERAPYPSQADVKKGTVQRSDTELGMATPIVHRQALSQRDVPAGTLQRSATPEGYATPIPQGDAIEAQRMREAADTKVAIGEPVKAAGNPSETVKMRGAKEASNAPSVPGPGDGENTSGLDAQGQPVAEDAAAAAAVEPADKPAEPVTRPRARNSARKSTAKKSAARKSSSPKK